MTDITARPTNVLEWHNQLYQHDADPNDIAFLEWLLGFLAKNIGGLLGGDATAQLDNLMRFEFHSSRPHGTLTAPVLIYRSERFEMCLLVLADGSWLVSIHMISRKHAGHAHLHHLIKDGESNQLDDKILAQLPSEWRFGTFDDSKQNFTVWLKDEYWLHDFVRQFIYELDQY